VTALAIVLSGCWGAIIAWAAGCRPADFAGVVALSATIAALSAAAYHMGV
jgi:hypothetical protein